MDNKMIEKKKKELAIAVHNRDYNRIVEISRILNISDEQKKYFDKGLTGFPSVDRVWLNNYSEGAEERALSYPKDKTIWDVLEEKLLEFYDIPAIEYFGRQISRPEFIDMCYTWARTFRAMGVEVGEKVPIYGIFVPEIAAMWFGLNMIGAAPYFLKLKIESPESLAFETREAKRAVVFDGMWGNVAEEFMKDKYKCVMVATATIDMPSPKREIVSFLSTMQSIKDKSRIPHDKKYIWLDKAMDIAYYYSGEVKVAFASNRTAVVTTSSGTTGKGVKAAEATNESVLAQAFSTIYSDIPTEKGLRVLNHFPPTAATSLNSLFYVWLMTGGTIVMDPRVDKRSFFEQLTTLGINVCINTAPMWDWIIRMFIYYIKRGREYDLHYAKAWMVGGQGPNIKQNQIMDKVMKENGGNRIYGGIGQTEIFSGFAIDRVDSTPTYDKPIPRIGAIQAGMIAGIFDKDGNELSYNQRGELWIKTDAMMKGYYGQPELTNAVIVDGWLRTGDMAEIDEEGFIYSWGRVTDSVKLPNGDDFYLFDISLKILSNDFIRDVIVLSLPTEDNDNNLVAHIVWEDNVSDEDKKDYIEIMNEQLEEFLPEGIVVSAYSEHDEELPYSDTTLKTDSPGMSQQTIGYVQVVDGELKNIKFILNESGKYTQEYAIMKKKRRGLFRK